MRTFPRRGEKKSWASHCGKVHVERVRRERGRIEEEHMLRKADAYCAIRFETEREKISVKRGFKIRITSKSIEEETSLKGPCKGQSKEEEKTSVVVGGVSASVSLEGQKKREETCF